MEIYAITRHSPGRESAKGAFVRGLNGYVLIRWPQIGCSRSPEIGFRIETKTEAGIRCAPLRGQLSRGAKHIDGIVAAHRFYLSHHATQMILHGELRQIQIGSYFLIGQPFGH
jgi:hypothetical protein